MDQAGENIRKSNLDKEYSAIGGDAEFCKLSIGLALNERVNDPVSPAVATVQSISGAGALRVGAAFLNSFAQSKNVYVPIPNWFYHTPIFGHAGMNIKSYRYYDPKTCGLDFAGALDDINVSSKSFSNLSGNLINFCVLFIENPGKIRNLVTRLCSQSNRR